MTPRRLTLSSLVVADGTLPPAEVRFTPGLNLIVGASDTGKTYVFEAIDFMLGSKDPLRGIPESAGYSRVSLAVDPSAGPPVTLRRGIRGGQVEVTEFTADRSAPAAEKRILSVTHSGDPESSLSAYLLRAIGAEGRHVRKNDRGETQALSLRQLCRFALVGEEQIIQKASPVVSENYTANTAERNVFAFLLTGQDDSDVIAQKDQRLRKARLEAEAATIESILAEKRAQLGALSADPAAFVSQAGRLQAAIEEASQTVAATQAEITGLERQRAALFEEGTAARSRTNFLAEQLGRLRLLDRYYLTDRARLTTLVEASRVFHDLPEGACPLCNRAYTTGEDAPPSHGEFESGCQKEVEKIDVLRRDLVSAIADFDAEEGRLQFRLGEIARSLTAIDEDVQRKLMPRSRTTHEDLKRLVQSRTSVAEGSTLLATVRGLEERLDRVRLALKEKPAKTVFDNRVTTSGTTELCHVIEGILRDWKYPDLGTVTFDTEKTDLVIGGQDRANKGKGYRAITYAAFTIGLMRYCRSKGIPHPGFVVLDTPVNPFKGPASTSPDDELTDEVKVAFFESLADDRSGDQVIIMENEEPPDAVRERVNYYSFTKRTDHGRYGFFPVRDLSATGATAPHPPADPKPKRPSRKKKPKPPEDA